MDPVTQGLLGSAVAQAFTQHKLRGQAAAIGAVAGIVPDLDILIRSSEANPLLGIYYHRHFTHSLFFIPFGGAIVALIFLLIFPTLRKRWPWVFAAAILGYATHGILDAFTSYGTLLYWPFSLERVHWDLIAIIDPFYTGVLLLGVILSIGFRQRHFAIIALILSGFYLGFNAYLHHKASLAQDTLITKRGDISKNRRVMPLIFHPFIWRSLYRDANTIHVDNIGLHLMGNSHTVPVANLSLFKTNALPNYIKNSPSLMQDYAIFNWFSDGYLSNVSTNPLTLADARYIFGSPHPVALWGIRFVKDKPHIKPVRHLSLHVLKTN